MSDLVTFDKQGGVGVITVNNPPVNALSQGVRQGLMDAIARGVADSAVSAMVIIGAAIAMPVVLPVSAPKVKVHQLKWFRRSTGPAGFLKTREPGRSSSGFAPG